MKSFSIIGPPATTILEGLRERFNSSIEKLDAVMAEYGLGSAVTLYGLVIGFQKDDVLSHHATAVTFNEELGYLVVNSDSPDGEELQRKIPNIEPTPKTITEAFGGKPLELDGKIHFMSIRYLGSPVLLVPDCMEVTLPEGLQPIKYVAV